MERILKLVLLAAAGSGLYLRAQYGYRSKAFAVGDVLYSGSERFGVVAEESSAHAFPGGQTLPAYLVERPDGTRLWLPQNDVKANFAATKKP
jgi:hypothetical protein